jgi:flagella basal body P-ring formation protein FlgA
MSTKINPLPASRNDLNGSSEVSGQSPLVRAGENVRVLIREDTIRIEVRGVAEQNAGLGKPVRVRLAKVGIDFDQASKEIVGVVSGPATVEMQP